MKHHEKGNEGLDKSQRAYAMAEIELKFKVIPGIEE